MVFVWGTRISNALGDSTLGGRALAGALTLSVTLIVAGVALAVIGWQGRGLVWAKVIVAAQAVVWLVRGTQIALDDHPAGFIAVHVGLGVISIALGVWVWRAVDRAREEFRAREAAPLPSAPLWDSP
jgi:hypothetical protein